MRTHRLALLVLVLVATVMSAACRTAPARDARPRAIASGASVCETAPAACAELCAKCPDRAGCFANGGECPVATWYFNDRGDAGLDLWTPGCHYRYADASCSDGFFYWGDTCDGDVVILEWTLSECHPPTADSQAFNCDDECRRIQRGGGRCVKVDGACPEGPSAYCKCDVPPPPNPTVPAP